MPVNVPTKPKATGNPRTPPGWKRKQPSVRTERIVRGRSASATEQDSFSATLGHEEREASARADAAEARAQAARQRQRRGEGPGRSVSHRGTKDNVPPGARTSGVPSPSPRRGSTLRSVNRSLRRFGGGNPRRLLIAEMVAVMAIVTIADIADGEVPRPANYVAPFVVYLVLAFLTEFGDDSARLAAGMGTLVLLALVLNHAGGILKALDYLAGTTANGPPSKHPTHNRKGD